MGEATERSAARLRLPEPGLPLDEAGCAAAFAQRHRTAARLALLGTRLAELVADLEHRLGDA